jgi:hypothetical protein
MSYALANSAMLNLPAPMNRSDGFQHPNNTDTITGYCLRFRNKFVMTIAPKA